MSARPDLPDRHDTVPVAAPGRHRRTRGFGAALAWTIAGAVVPGTGFLAAGRRALGVLTLLVFLCLVGGGAWMATSGRRTAVRAVVNTDRLLWIVAGLGLVALLWVIVIIAGYRMLVPRGTARGRRVLGGLVVAVLVLAVAAPAAYAGRLALVQRDLISGLFVADGRSATVEDNPNPFGHKDRVNVLLLGGDSGPGRDGTRTDTVIVASIDTHTGDTTLFSLPRNLENLPFPPGSPLAKVYPNGFQAGSESESLLNAIYRNGPQQHPDILGPTDHPGADFLKLGVGQALGLHLDYFVLVNLEGFSRLVDALGGITVNVNYWVPVNGDQATGELPDDYIAPGPHRHMDGYTALQFARGRFGLNDYLRMDRQRCAIDAIIQAADPVTLLRKYQQLAATTKDIVSTDIPRSALDDFVELAFRVKDAHVRSVVFDQTVIDPAYPDYDQMRAIVAGTLRPRAPVSVRPDDSPQSAVPGPVSTPTPTPTPAPSSAAGSSVAAGAGPVTDVTRACAFDPKQAQDALAHGKPPTRKG